MPQAHLTVKLPSMVWIGELSREFPAVTFRVLAAFPREDTGVGLVELRGAALAETVETLEAYDEVLSLEILERSADSWLIQFETSDPLLLSSVQKSGVPLELPIEIEDGRATLTVTASQDRLSTFGSYLEKLGMQFDVESIHRSVESTEQLLTESQRDLLLAAIREGYYDTPRQCTLTELAETVDMAKSTVSGTLHRAEETIVTEFAADLDDELITEYS